MEFNLRNLAKKTLEIPDKLSENVANDKHLTMLEVIKPYARDKNLINKNLTPIYTNYKTRKSKLVLVLCPEWSPYMPPFNLARLSGVAKSAGFETHIIDINVQAYNKFKNDWEPNGKIPFRLWDPAGSWHWQSKDIYMKDIHHLLKPLLEAEVNRILDINPDLVGFTAYYTNEEPTKWMAKELKRKNPNIKIAVGGSNAQKSWFKKHYTYDYIVNGEGEGALLTILEEIENGFKRDKALFIEQPVNQRININGMPMPDYESIDFSLYELPNGVNTEFSRGCTAKCSFCEETHFWKYRQRQAVDVLTEVEWLYYNKGTTVFWFIDSLVNGNVNELRAFSKAVAAKDLKIHWTGYSRCDGKMDLEFFKDLAAGGCVMLNYGIESGSQKVLDHMHKGVTVAEMEQNLIDGKKVGIFAATNWIVGFPTEDLQDFADSMTFLWRMRNMNINNVGAGVGFAQGPETLTGQNPKKFGLSYYKYQNHWITEDFTKGGTHVMHRVKTFHIFLDLMTGCTDIPFGYPIRYSLAKDHYKINLVHPTRINELEGYEKFDYNIIKPNISPFADSLVNEMWPFFRLLWQCRGGYTAKILFNPQIDLNEFGSQFGPGMLDAVYNFEITSKGLWKADFTWDFKQVENPYDDRPDDLPPFEKGPFFAQDYSKMNSNAAKRARKLSKPDWDIETGRSQQDINDLISGQVYLNKNIDFTFSYSYKKEGRW